MNQITGVNARLKNILTKYRLFSLIWLVFLAFQPSLCSAQDAREGIKELKNGTLLVRFPSYKNKIDTLTAMISRVTDEASMKRLLRLREQTVGERDSVHRSYVKAFKDYYDFSEVAYYSDHESRNLSTAHFYRLSGEEISSQELHKKPVYYLFFERTEESKIDALVVYNAEMKKNASPISQ